MLLPVTEESEWQDMKSREQLGSFAQRQVRKEKDFSLVTF